MSSAFLICIGMFLIYLLGRMHGRRREQNLRNEGRFEL